MKNKKLLIGIGIGFLIGVVLLACIMLENQRRPTVKSGQIRIGLVVSLTGPSAGTGKPTANAIQLLKDKYPDAEFYIEDSKSSPIAGIQAARKLVELHSVDVIYCDLTNVASALLDYTETKGVILMAPIILADFTRRGKYSIRNFMTLDQQVSVVTGKYLSDCLGNTSRPKRLVAIASNDEFGRNSIEGLNQCLQNLDNIICQKVYFLENSVDSIRNVAFAANNLQPDAIFASSFSSSLGSTIKALREEGFTGVILTTTAFTVPYIRDAAGDATFNVIYPDFLKTPLYDSLSDAYVSRFQATPPLTTFLCYDGLSFLITAWRNWDGDNIEEMLTESESLELDGAYGRVRIKNREIMFQLQAFMTEQKEVQDGN